MKFEGFLKEAKCPICKKIFVVPPLNVYKIIYKNKKYHYCSYTCFRVDQKKLEKKISKESTY